MTCPGIPTQLESCRVRICPWLLGQIPRHKLYTASQPFCSDSSPAHFLLPPLSSPHSREPMLPPPLPSHSPGLKTGSLHSRSKTPYTCPHLFPPWALLPEAALTTLPLSVTCPGWLPGPCVQPPCCDCFIPGTECIFSAPSKTNLVPLPALYISPPLELSQLYPLMWLTLLAPFTMEKGHVLTPQLLFQLPPSTPSSQLRTSPLFYLWADQGFWASTF